MWPLPQRGRRAPEPGWRERIKSGAGLPSSLWFLCALEACLCLLCWVMTFPGLCTLCLAQSWLHNKRPGPLFRNTELWWLHSDLLETLFLASWTCPTGLPSPCASLGREVKICLSVGSSAASQLPFLCAADRLRPGQLLPLQGRAEDSSVFSLEVFV